MATLLELKNQVDDAIKRQRGGEIDLTIIETQLKNKKMVLERLEQGIKELEKQRDSLESDNKARNRALDEAAMNRKNEADALMKKALDESEKARLEKNAISIEKNVLEDQKNQVLKMKKESEEKISALRDLVQKMSLVF